MESLELASKVVLGLAVCEAAVMLYKASSGEKIWGVALVAIAILNGYAILQMYSDKMAARRGEWRTPEKVLLVMS
jgi:hypothetical protein